MSSLVVPRAVVVLALALLTSGCEGPREPSPPRSDGEAAAAALAASDRPFLVMDLARRRLDLYHGGALLQEFPWTDGEIGGARITGGGGARALPGSGPWMPSTTSPRRRTESRVIRPSTPGAPDPAGAVDFVPPRPEELNPDPGRLRIRYAGGLVLDLIADDVGAPKWTWSTGTVIRVRMPRERLGSLFRSLPDSTPLVVLAPPPGE